MKKSNNEKEFLSKIVNNKILLFLVPNLICWYQLFYYYNQNAYLVVSVLFYEVIIGCIVFLVMNTLIFLLLQIFLKDKIKVFLVMCGISIFFLMKPDLLAFIIFSIFIIIAVIIFKYLINFSLDILSILISLIVVILFSFTFLTSIYNLCYIVLKSKSYDYAIDFKVEEDKNKPNIYWIHCDGMMSLDTLRKYFNEDYPVLENYLEINDYYYNPEALLKTGHSTMKSLVALFNPYYYDDFYNEYLVDLEKQYLGEKKNTDFIINYYELEEKRLNNELFQAFEEAGYETVAISDYSSYTSFYTDQYYDFYHYLELGDPYKELKYFKNGDNSELKLKSQIRLIHSSLLFSNTIFNYLVNNMNLLNYSIIDYNDNNLEDYYYTNNTSYWYSKAIFKAIDVSYNKDNSQFTFINYKLNHLPLNYDSFGNFLQPDDRYNLDYYIQNYIYASNLLIEMLEHIKSTDDKAVIIVQADHGIHMLEDDFIMQELDINKEELQEVRNSVISAIYVPDKYRNDDEEFLSNPLNISRYLVNNFVGDNYEYIN